MLSLLWLSVLLICYQNGAAEEVSMKSADMQEINLNLVNKLMEMEEQLKALQTHTENLDGKLEHEKLTNAKKFVELEKRIGIMEKELLQKSRNEKRMEKTIRTMLRRMNHQQEVCKAIDDDLQQLKAVVREDEDVADSGVEDIDLEKKNSNGIVERSSKRQVAENSTKIAFSAYLNQNQNGLGVNHILLFAGITLNEGSAYNQYTGIFTAPESGVYLFSTFVEYNMRHRLRVKIVVNGSTKSSVFSYDNQGGNVVILRLIAGNSVWVAIDESSDSIVGSAVYKVSTFSGVYLYP